MQKDKKITSNKYKKQQILIILVLALCFVTLASSLGRYAINQINNFFVRTKEFYFYSDKLKANGAVYQIDNWTGIDPYTVTVNMNSLENNLKKASYDISYDITYTCSSTATCQLSKSSGIISSSNNSDYFNLVITPNTNLVPGNKVTVTIIATSTSTYKKQLSATFTLIVGRESVSYEIVDEAYLTYLDFNITNTLSYYTVDTAFDSYKVGDNIDVDTYLGLTESKKEKCYSAMITLKFDPRTVILDMTNTNYLNAISQTTTSIDGTNYINGVTFKVEPISSTVVRFYKKDITKDYTYPIINATPIVEFSSK